MSWSSGRVVPLAALAMLCAPAAHAVDAARLDLLAGEAVSVMGNAAAAPSRTGLVVLIAIPLLTMLSAFLGTLLGIRGLSFGSLRDRDGWREVAYRFRSDRPMTVGKDVIQRMSGVLDDIEDLGRNLRAGVAKPAAKPEPAAGPAPAAKAETPAPATVAAVAPEVPREEPRAKRPGLWSGRNGGRAAAPPVEPVTFFRREEPAGAPVAPAAVAAEPVEAAIVAAPPPQPIARSAGEDTDRSMRYRRARALLDQGHDRETVRSLTGLKLAEVDLLRCAGAPGGLS